jgi:hypothetical protein
MRSGGAVTRWSSSSTVPLVAGSSPVLSNVVLPRPNGPTMHTNSPGLTSNETSPIACVACSPVPYVLLIVNKVVINVTKSVVYLP